VVIALKQWQPAAVVQIMASALRIKPDITNARTNFMAVWMIVMLLDFDVDIDGAVVDEA
jgi:hypothetical protein